MKWLLLLFLLACSKNKPTAPADGAEAPAADVAEASAVDVAEAPADEVPQEERGLNDRFLDPDLDVEEWATRFEGESREVAAQQPAILNAMAIAPGESVADIGAGTGLYLGPFAEAVGDEGQVYAVDISPRFLDHLRTRVKTEGLSQARVIEGTATSTNLPEDSVDAVFICDTYHHFESPPDTLASLFAAMKPGGRLYLLDFERIEGESSDWIMGHVRAGKDVFRKEVESAGFTFDGELEVGLEDNYLLRFQRP